MPISEKPGERKRAGRIVCIRSRGNAGNLRQGATTGQRRKDDIVNTFLILIRVFDSNELLKSRSFLFARQSQFRCCKLHIAKYFLQFTIFHPQ